VGGAHVATTSIELVANGSNGRGAAWPRQPATMQVMDGGRTRFQASHRVRATVTFAAAAAVVSVAVAGIAYAASRSYLTDQREEAGRERAYLDARIVRDQLRSPVADPGAALAAIAPEEGVTALVRVDGAWFSSSVAVDADQLPVDVLDAAGDGLAGWKRTSIRGAPHLVVAVPLPAVDAVYAEVIPLRRLDEALGTIGRALVIAAALTTIAGAGIGFLAAGRLVRPLRRLAEQAEAIARGQVADLADVPDPELRPIVGSLNRAIEGYVERVEAGTRFASDVSHEVRAPLATLTAAIEVMQRRRHQLPEQTAAALDVLAEQVSSFSELVLDLLEISVIDAGRAELRAERSAAEPLVRAAAAAVGAPEVSIHIAPDVPAEFLVDRRRLAQALGNLLENARRYAGGATGISVERHHDRLRFIVEDRGPGVDEAEREAIFGRFERGEHGRSGPRGTGLGLALVAEHAALHGGRAYVEPRDGGGARFVVEVALCE
jgi:two-component system sensor histidine kinase MtrB